MYRWERRAAKLEARKRRMPVHGKAMGEMYANAVKKRIGNNSHLTGDLPDDIMDMLEYEDSEED